MVFSGKLTVAAVVGVYVVLGAACGSDVDPIGQSGSPVKSSLTPTPAVPAATPFVYRPEIKVEIPPTGPTETDSGLTVQEVLNRSREHATLATTFRSRSGNYLILEAEGLLDSNDRGFNEFVTPSSMRSVDPYGTVWAIIVDGVQYTRSPNNDDKWWKLEGIGDEPPSGLLPVTQIMAELAGAHFTNLDDSDHYFVEGYASSLTRSDATIETTAHVLKLTRLKIRKTDFAFVGSVDWSLPLFVDTDEILTREELAARKSRIQEGPLDHLVEIFDYNTDIEILPPAKSFVGAFGRGPRSDQPVPLSPEIAYQLTRPVGITNLSITPHAELILDREVEFDGPSVARIYRPETPLEPSTEYSVTLEWGTSNEDLQTISWSFTTTTRLGLRSE